MRLGVSTTTAVQWARQQGIPVNARPKWLSASARRKIEGLLASGETFQNIGIRSGASATSINRVLAANQEIKQTRRAALFAKKRADCRREFSETVRKEPSISIKNLRLQPNFPYTWLYRNDHPWLIAAIEKRGKRTSHKHRRAH
jgi:hypothetical protein